MAEYFFGVALFESGHFFSCTPDGAPGPAPPQIQPHLELFGEKGTKRDRPENYATPQGPRFCPSMSGVVRYWPSLSTSARPPKQHWRIVQGYALWPCLAILHFLRFFWVF